MDLVGGFNLSEKYGTSIGMIIPYLSCSKPPINLGAGSWTKKAGSTYGFWMFLMICTVCSYTFDGFFWGVPSGKHTKNDGTSPFLLGKLMISMAIFQSYVSLPGGSAILVILMIGLTRATRWELQGPQAIPAKSFGPVPTLQQTRTARPVDPEISTSNTASRHIKQVENTGNIQKHIYPTW